MAEVTRQLGPLGAKVDRTHYAVERLFNTNGGPEGYLQAARREDNGRFEMIFKMLKEHKDEIQPVKDFINTHKAQEEVHEADKKELATKMNVRLGVFTLVILVIQLFAPSMQGCRKVASSFIDPPAHSQLSTIPPLTR